MGINNKKIIIFDIDETLVENEVYPKNMDEYINVMKMLKKNNYYFGICTNRPLEKFVKQIVNKYKINEFIICEGGACIYKKILGFYILRKTFVNKNTNRKLKKQLKNQLEYIKLNDKRIRSSTIKILNKSKKNTIIKKLNKIDWLKDYIVQEKNLKITIESKHIDKIKTINNLYKCESVIFVTDYEKRLSMPNINVKIYSVGEDKIFNKTCHLVYSKSTLGVLEILKKEGMKYEKI